MLTPQQSRLLAFITRYQRENDGVSPSFAEMCDGIGITSKSGIHRLLVSLETRGFVERLPYRDRAIRVIGHDPLPAAPTPILVAELERRRGA